MEKTETSRLLLSLIHSIFCKKEHPKDCDFYSDIELADCWDLPDIICWSTLTQLMMKRMNTTEKGLLDSMAKVHKCLEGLSILSHFERKLFMAILRDADLSVLILAEEPNQVSQSCEELGESLSSSSQTPQGSLLDFFEISSERLPPDD